MSASIDIRGLRRAFRSAAVLDGVDLAMRPGEFVALLGRSGSGKTTLLRVLAGLDAGAAADRLALPPRRAVVFQEPRLMPWKTVIGNVVLGLAPAGARAKAARALADVEIAHRADAWPLTLSGGEAQRAALARALVREPQLLLLDEPFASLDALTRLRMQDLVLELWRRHRPAVLLVTHDVREAVALADRILVLDRGRLRRDCPVALDRPRLATDERVARLETALLADLGVKPAAGAREQGRDATTGAWK